MGLHRVFCQSDQDWRKRAVAGFKRHIAVHAATRAEGEAIEVSVTSVNNKLQQIEPSTSAALVGWSAQRATELIEEVGGQRAPLPGKVVAVVASEDAYTQERALRPEVVRQHVGAGQVWDCRSELLHDGVPDGAACPGRARTHPQARDAALPTAGGAARDRCR